MNEPEDGDEGFVARFFAGMFLASLFLLVAWFACLSYECFDAKQTLANREERASHLGKLQEESEIIEETIARRKVNEKDKRVQIKSIALGSKGLENFPIVSGSQFVVCGPGSSPNRGLRMYVPDGKHELRIDIGRSKFNQSDKRIPEGEHFIKTLALPSGQVCEFNAVMTTREKSFLVELSLVDQAGENLFEKSLTFPRREEENGLNGGGTSTLPREYVFQPNQYRPSSSPDEYSHWTNFRVTKNINLGWKDDARRVFLVDYSIHSPESLPFVAAGDAGGIPLMLRAWGKSFEEVFEPLADGKYLMKPGIAEFLNMK